MVSSATGGVGVWMEGKGGEAATESEARLPRQVVIGSGGASVAGAPKRRCSSPTTPGHTVWDLSVTSSIEHAPGLGYHVNPMQALDEAGKCVGKREGCMRAGRSCKPQ